MFNIGFSEMLVIGIIALIVVGPDKLPELARTVGKWVGAARRVFAEVKAEVDQQVMMDDIVQHNRAIMEMEAIPPEKKREGSKVEDTPTSDISAEQGASVAAEVNQQMGPVNVEESRPPEAPAPDRLH